MRGATHIRDRKCRIASNFYSRTSCEVQHVSEWQLSVGELFLLTHLMRGATVNAQSCLISRIHFYSRTSCEVQLEALARKTWYENFYSRTSCEVQPRNFCQLKDIKRYFYSRTSCEVQHKKEIKKIIREHFYSRTSCEVQPIFSM